MTGRTRDWGARAVWLTALTVCLGATLQGTAGQTPARLLVSVLDADGAPVTGLTREDFTLRLDGAVREVISVEPAGQTVQVVAIFEGLAATQRQTSAAITSFIASLDGDSIVDMQSVDGELDAAIVEAVGDLHARGASRPVIVMIGQATAIVPSELRSSQVRGKRQAADLSGDLDQLARLQAEHGILLLWRGGHPGVAGEFSGACRRHGRPLRGDRQPGRTQQHLDCHRARTGHPVSSVVRVGRGDRDQTGAGRRTTRSERARRTVRTDALTLTVGDPRP